FWVSNGNPIGMKGSVGSCEACAMGTTKMEHTTRTADIITKCFFLTSVLGIDISVATRPDYLTKQETLHGGVSP
ncbi:MAG: hypothetical protein MN733_36130, partial [Nitrososphaera sp.]|nr:hypothetical protein [Nitrososphaera sp.]